MGSLQDELQKLMSKTNITIKKKEASNKQKSKEKKKIEKIHTSS